MQPLQGSCKEEHKISDLKASSKSSCSVKELQNMSKKKKSGLRGVLKATWEVLYERLMSDRGKWAAYEIALIGQGEAGEVSLEAAN